jgi:ATP-dependent helicase/DNAse subunit B
MASTVELIVGPANSGKTESLLERYRRTLRETPPRKTLWLAPNARAAQQVRLRLLDDSLQACLAPRVMTFAGFADLVIHSSTRRVTPLTNSAKRELLGWLIQEQHRDGKLSHFGPIVATAGLVDLVSEHIRELKRLEIWPHDFRDACQARDARAGSSSGEMRHKDRELLGLYESYQEALNLHQLYDAEGRFWSARELLTQGQQRPITDATMIVVDGFTDFTRPQFEILQELSRRTEQLVVSLPVEPPSGRDDLFAKTQDTLARFRRLFGEVPLETAARSPKRWSRPALAHLERELFKSPRQRTIAEDGEGIEILGGAGSVGEFEAVARHIKRLLVEGDPSGAGEPPQQVDPQDVVVVMRSVSSAAPLLREMFTRFGIPLALATGHGLNEARGLTFLVSLLQLVNEDWPFRVLLSVVTSNYFRPTWLEGDLSQAVVATERIIRLLQRPDEREPLLREIQRLTETEPKLDEDPDDPDQKRQWERLRERVEMAQQAQRLLSGLAAALDRLPTRATKSQWGEALQRLATETGLVTALEQGGSQPAMDATTSERATASEGNIAAPQLSGASDEANNNLDAQGVDETAAWQHFLDLLAGADRLSRNAGRTEPRLDCAELLHDLGDLLSREEIPRLADETGRVRIVSAPLARGMEIPYLYFASLGERSFPSSERSDRIYTESELRRLARAGLPLVLRAQRQQEEMLLFYEVACRAQRRLVLSYPAFDEQAQPLLASPYVDEVRELFSPGALRMDCDPDLRPAASRRGEASFTDYRRQSVLAALHEDRHLAQRILQSPISGVPLENIRAALQTIHQRQQRDEFGPFEGMFFSPAALAELNRRFPPDMAWSPSRLEQYASCPWKFFVEHILKLSVPKELSLGTDSLVRGSVLHDVMAALHRRYRNEDPHATVIPPGDESQFVEQFKIEVQLQYQRLVLGPVEEALAEIDQHHLSLWAGRYFQQAGQYEKRCHPSGDADWVEPLRPSHFELSFGPEPRPEDDPLSTTRSLVLKHFEEQIHLQGRVDRIDVGRRDPDEPPLFNIIDYKTGSAQNAGNIKELDGRLMQLDIYALAVQELLFADREAQPMSAGYWFVRNDGFKGMVPPTSKNKPLADATFDWQQRREELVRIIFRLVGGIRQGQFPVFNPDEHCTRNCDYRQACRINQIRSLEKQWEPPRPNST